MLVLTLGSQASGSTWLFNAVRLLFGRAGSPLFTLSADDGLDALDRMPLRMGDVLLKAHSMDQRLMRVARLAGAKVIVSTRDPLDSVVSQRERFHLSTHLAAVDLTRSFASIESLPDDLPRLELHYESCFTGRIGTLAEIARFIGVPASSEDLIETFAALRPDVVRRQISARREAQPDGGDLAQDPLTQWHPGHVGDGQVGKWRERLDATSREAISGCVVPLASHLLWQRQELCWTGQLFQYDGGEAPAPSVDLACCGDGRPLVHGPYLHLPRGRWRATPMVEAASRWRGVRLASDVYLPNSGREANRSCGTALGHEASGLSVEFDHDDHFQPIEVRLSSVAGSRGSIRFSGCTLRWMGPAS